jgi:PKD repeat protein
MQKKLIQLLLVVLLLLLCSTPIRVQAADNSDGMDKLVLIQGSKKMFHNGTIVMATQPLTSSKGISYVAAKSLMNEIFGKVVYDTKTKQYVVSSGQIKLSFTVGKIPYMLNENIQNVGVGAPYVLNGTLMIPLRTVAKNLGIILKAVPNSKNIELSWDSKPVAKFSVSNVNPYAQQTEVAYTDLSYHPRGLAVINERWENNLNLFDQAGTYAVSHWVQDETGKWSDAYTVMITVKPPNQPPVAAFSTDKESYKMGELIRYTDQSTDDENRITSRVWTNNKRGFFEPGPQTVTLKVTDANGAVNEYSKTVTIENETLYPKEQFDLLYTEIGEKFLISGSDVLKYPAINYVINPMTQTLVRANSPETIVNEGIYYEDAVSGNVRFLVHNYNSRTTPVKVYVIATNEINNEVATVQVGPVGIGGPSSSVPTVGRSVTGRYLESRLNPKYSTVQIPPGESRILVPEFSAKAVNPGDTYSMFADFVMDKKLKVQVVIVSDSRDVLSYLPFLSILPIDNSHVRGTFEEANRTVILDQTIGNMKQRMILADNVVDTKLSGMDKTTNMPVLNAGNYGALYTIRLNNVQPHTAIIVNPRGGLYSGAFNVNGTTVYNTSMLMNSNEAGMLYKTGDAAESVTIEFTPASGSNLPINLLFIPIPVS